MSTMLSVSIYGRNSNSIGTNNGVTMGFPSANVTIQPAPANTTFNGVTVLSVIQLIPGGTVVNQPKFYSSATVSTLITAANA